MVIAAVRAGLFALRTLVPLLLVGCTEVPATERPVAPADATAGSFELSDCLYIYRETEYAAECGLIYLPENRYDPTSRLIALPFKRIPSTSDRPAEPLFHLTGGPGQSNLGFGLVDWYRDNRDIVLVGYRGVDGTVQLSCPEVDDALAAPVSMMSPEGMRLQTDAYAACATRLTKEGVDLDGYTLLEVVDDVEAVRHVLGYERVNLKSVSYGTRLAMIYMWRYPEAVHRSAMVAVNPPGRFWWDPSILERQILRYAELCEEDEYCSSRTDDLADSIRTAIENAPTSWLGFRVDLDATLFATFISLYSVEGAAATFDVWLAAADGDYSGMALITAVTSMMLPSGFAWGDSAAKAGSVDYDIDPTVDYSAEVRPGRYLLGSPGSALGWASMPGWPTNKIPDEYRTEQPSSIPTLMLSGTLDVSTPAENATNQLLPVFENVHQVILPDFAHSPDLIGNQREATRHLLTTFFDRGVVDDSRFEPIEISFEPDWGFPLIAKLLLLAVLVSVIIVAVLLRWLYLVVRRWRAAP